MGLFVNDLCYEIAGKLIVSNITLLVQAGEVHAIVGPNGSGKSTLFSTIVGHNKHQNGEVVWQNENLAHLPLWKRVQKGIGYLAQESLGFNQLTVLQNLLAIPNVTSQQIDEVLTAVGLAYCRDRKLGVLSGGERRRIDFARLFLLKSKLWVLDEPFAALDLESVHWMVEQISLAKTKDIAILLTDHALAQVLQVADRISILDRGTILLSGSLDELNESPLFRQRYSMH